MLSRRTVLHLATSGIVAIPFTLEAKMIEPKSMAEQLMFCTVRIVGSGDRGSKTGTGFIYNAEAANGTVPLLFTNKHVANDTTSLQFLVHTRTDSNAGRPDGNAAVHSERKDWIDHPKPEIDLCALPLAGVLNQMTGPFPFYVGLTPAIIKQGPELEELNAVEELLMVGYPNGLWDAKNNLPLMRRGVTSTHPAIDYDVSGAPSIVMDIACFPGSSGSPVFIYNNGTIIDRSGNVSIASRIILLGVLYAGPTFQADGSIVIRDIPTASVPVPQLNLMMNLGYAVKAREIEALVQHAFKKLNVEPKK